MIDTYVFLAIALVAAGLYITHLHVVLGRYRKWASQAQALLMSLSMKAAMEEYGFDVKERDECED